MKTFLVVVLLALAVHGNHLPAGSGPYNSSKLVKEEGYPVQTLQVETEDGYRLEITRIPGSREERDDIVQKLTTNGNVKTNKPVVLLMHGIFGDSSEFLINSENSLAYLLAEKGYDVFLGNFRGVRNSDDHHTQLNGHKDRAFWDYCFDDMGTKDLPAIINKVLKVTGEQKLYYIGFNQANTALYVLLSEQPEFNKKIEKAVALGPVVFMKNSRNPLIQFISDNYKASVWVSKWLGSHQFIPSQDLINKLNKKCIERHGQENLCNNLYFLTNAFGRVYENTVATKYAQAYPSKISTQELLHFAEMMKTDKFQPFKRNNEDGEEYDLKKITVPMTIISVPQDILSDERDVDALKNQLPNVEEHIKVNDYSSHLDLIIDNNARNVIYENVVEKLRKRQE